jgi:hypothetical protein
MFVYLEVAEVGGGAAAALPQATQTRLVILQLQKIAWRGFEPAKQGHGQEAMRQK